MGDRTWPHLLTALLRGEELSTADTAWAMGEIMSGSAAPAQIAGFAVALRAKGETPAEVTGLVEAMLSRAVPVELPEKVRAEALDVVGTGATRPHGEHLHDDGAGRAGAAYAWSSTATGPPRPPAAPPICWSSSAFHLISGPSRWPGASPRPASLLLRRPVPPRHAPRRSGPPGVGGADRVQLPRPADQSRPSPLRGRRLLRRDDGAGDGGRLRGPGRLGAGDARRGRAGRVHHRCRDPVLDRPERGRQGDRGGRGRPRRTPGHPRRTARRRRGPQRRPTPARPPRVRWTAT